MLCMAVRAIFKNTYTHNSQIWSLPRSIYYLYNNVQILQGDLGNSGHTPACLSNLISQIPWSQRVLLPIFSLCRATRNLWKQICPGCLLQTQHHPAPDFWSPRCLFNPHKITFYHLQNSSTWIVADGKSVATKSLNSNPTYKLTSSPVILLRLYLNPSLPPSPHLYVYHLYLDP